ncbi:MAG: bifunctional 2-polyprenyl-6-hydroxyphenol methylase/3-demethylubiquinol 3-O-methyltransferase UbiG, partial [Pseudomonadota bacterium]
PDALKGLRIADVGCGGGLLCEPLARLGADVVGVDASSAAIAAAQAHAVENGLEIDYRCAVAGDLVAAGEAFDVVLAMEVIEHTPDPRRFIDDCAALLKPGGLFFGSTLNRSAKAFALAIVGAEYVLRWLPAGTHDWRRFVRPAEFARYLAAAGLHVTDRKGIVFNPLRRAWSLSDHDLDVNYALVAER